LRPLFDKDSLVKLGPNLEVLSSGNRDVRKDPRGVAEDITLQNYTPIKGDVVLDLDVAADLNIHVNNRGFMDEELFGFIAFPGRQVRVFFHGFFPDLQDLKDIEALLAARPGEPAIHETIHKEFGTSDIIVGNRVKIGTAPVEEDRRLEVLPFAKAIGLFLDLLNPRVEAFQKAFVIRCRKYVRIYYRYRLNVQSARITGESFVCLAQ
jgi:hypothetical protein